MNTFVVILYLIGLYSAFVSGIFLLRVQSEADPGAGRLPCTTLLLLLIVGIPSILQFFFPGLLRLLQRDYARFVHGEWWRLVTSLVVQDGGVGGTVSNLVALALIGSVAERLWDGRKMLLIFLAGGILAQFIAFLWQPTGAGNSVGNFSLAAGVAVTALIGRSAQPAQILALLALVADGILLPLQDIHGAAALIGAILAIFLVCAPSDRA